MAASEDVEEDMKTDEMIASERPIVRTVSFRRRLTGRLASTQLT